MHTAHLFQLSLSYDAIQIKTCLSLLLHPRWRLSETKLFLMSLQWSEVTDEELHDVPFESFCKRTSLLQKCVFVIRTKLDLEHLTLHKIPSSHNSHERGVCLTWFVSRSQCNPNPLLFLPCSPLLPQWSQKLTSRTWLGREVYCLIYWRKPRKRRIRGFQIVCVCVRKRKKGLVLCPAVWDEQWSPWC